MTNQCGNCERMRTLLQRLHSMLAARDVVVFSQELGLIEAELQGRNGSVGEPAADPNAAAIEEAQQDLMVFGICCTKRDADGKITRVHPKDIYFDAPPENRQPEPPAECTESSTHTFVDTDKPYVIECIHCGMRQRSTLNREGSR